MAKHQPELQRSGLGPADPGSTRTQVQGDPGVLGKGATGPVPEDNRPGHHPDHEQDKPADRYVARARELAAEARRDAAAPEQPTADGPRRVLSPEAFVPLLSFIDAARRSEDAWSAIGESRWEWLGRIALLPFLGTWRYATSVRPRLEETSRSR